VTAKKTSIHDLEFKSTPLLYKLNDFAKGLFWQTERKSIQVQATLVMVASLIFLIKHTNPIRVSPSQFFDLFLTAQLD